MLHKLILGLLITTAVSFIGSNHTFAQAQFRLPMNCDELGSMEHRNFKIYIKERVKDPLAVYKYLESVRKYNVLCDLGQLKTHMLFAEIMKLKVDLNRHDVVAELGDMLLLPGIDSDMIGVVARQYMFESFNNGKYDELDSLSFLIDWKKLPNSRISDLSRALSLLLQLAPVESVNLGRIQDRINESDTLKDYVYRFNDLSHLSINLEHLFNEDKVIEANILLLLQLRSASTESLSILEQQLKPLWPVIKASGFTAIKTEAARLELLPLNFEFETEVYHSVSSTVLDSGSNDDFWMSGTRTVLLALLSLVMVFVWYRVFVFLIVLRKEKQLSRSERMEKLGSFLIRLSLLKRHENIQNDEKN